MSKNIKDFGRTLNTQFGLKGKHVIDIPVLSNVISITLRGNLLLNHKKTTPSLNLIYRKNFICIN